MKRIDLNTAKRLPLVVGVALLIAASTGLVYAQVGGGYDLSWSSVDGGGGTSSSGGIYSMGGTIGQPDAGQMSGGNYGLTGGFWGATASTPTPPATSTPTRTSTPGTGGVVTGHLTWQGIPQPDSRNTGVTATLTLCVGGSPQNYGVATDANGFFTVTTGLPNGSYNWRLKGVINLANAGTLSLSGGAASPEMGTMRAGDSNDSGNVNIVDFNIVKTAFGTGTGGTGYDDRANFNRDTVVNAVDFNLLKGSFSQASSPLVCP